MGICIRTIIVEKWHYRTKEKITLLMYGKFNVYDELIAQIITKSFLTKYFVLYMFSLSAWKRLRSFHR